MLRLFLLAAVATSLLAGLMPASAQNFKGSCIEWCLQNRCARGAMNQTKCMNRCVPVCKHKNPKAHD